MNSLRGAPVGEAEVVLVEHLEGGKAFDAREHLAARAPGATGGYSALGILR
jgi:hypothetical protein